ncbi:putative Zinc finger C2H2-type domain protein [Thiocapsa sp. KS1]|nr:C2H2-type zinc finger protein [Thiocapsa sp. KS1]CRI65315.1 putative Zinc finger C2H2-type domain protein [Thiocapsa sp. KS1]
MGFWHTGYFEFKDPLDLEGAYKPGPTIYRCQQCDATFNTAEALRTHRFEHHTHNRPTLFLAGREVGTTPARVTRHINPDEVVASHCERVWLNQVAVAPENLGFALAAIANDTAKLRLINKDIAADYTICFEIAADEDLAGVDRCFAEVARRGRLDRRSVEDFIAAAHAHPTAIRYCDGICEYFYGVLTKERSRESSLPYGSYREKFTRASDVLQDFDRPLGRMICDLIAFHFNHFHELNGCAPTSRIQIASARFKRWLTGNPIGAEALLSRPHNEHFERLLTDLEAEKIIAWSVKGTDMLRAHTQDMEAMLRQDLAEFDRTKLTILLAEVYAHARNVSGARRYARELRNSPTLGDWAEHLLARLSEIE